MEEGKVATALFVFVSVLSLLLLGNLVQSFEFDEMDLVTEDSLWALYERWRSHYKVSRDDSEKKIHFSSFREKAKYIHEFNMKRDAPYQLELNKFSDMTELEIRNVFTSFDLKDHQSKNLQQKKGGAAAEDYDSPSSIDWRENGAVTEVKDQGKCDSSWAFSAAAALEGLNRIKTGKLVEISSQQLIDCDESNSACCGGDYNTAFEFMINNGLTGDWNYPYTCINVSCNGGQSSHRMCNTSNIFPYVTRPNGYEKVASNNETALEEAVAQQPVSVTVDVNSIEFLHYKGGIFIGEYCGTNVSQAMTIVGYGRDDNKTGLDFWVVKNSWGTDWGEEGYIRMLRGVSAKEGVCGIAMLPSYPTLSVSTASST